MDLGIYAIINTKDKKVYIGSTTNFRRRWNKHRSDLSRGAHHNSHLQRAWDKYGGNTFEFGILEHLDNPEELHLAEQFWMDIYREEGTELYNYGLVAQHAMLGRARSEETKEKIRRANLGKKATEETKHKLSKQRRGKQHFNWGKSLSDETRAKISVALSGERNGMWGKQWTEEARRKIGEANSKSHPAFIHRVTGEIIPAGKNLNALCRERGLTHSLMYLVTVGGRNHHKGWKLKQQMENV